MSFASKLKEEYTNEKNGEVLRTYNIYREGPAGQSLEAIFGKRSIRLIFAELPDERDDEFSIKTDVVEVKGITRWFEIYAEELLKEGAVFGGAARKDIKIKFATPDIEYLANNYEMKNIELYMSRDEYYKFSKAVPHYIEKENSKKPQKIRKEIDNHNYLEAYFKSEQNKEFILIVLFGEEDEPYLARAYNFFTKLSKYEVKPKDNLGPIFSSQDLNRLFSEFNLFMPGDRSKRIKPRMEAGHIYKLDQVIRRDADGNVITLAYFDVETREYNTLDIEVYPDEHPNGDALRYESNIKGYFGKQSGKYFIPAEDIYDGELDYMRVPRENPFILKFFGIKSGKEGIFKNIKRWFKEMERRWEERNENWNTHTIQNEFDGRKRRVLGPDRVE